jgi:hypothetical protein
MRALVDSCTKDSTIFRLRHKTNALIPRHVNLKKNISAGTKVANRTPLTRV